MSRRTPKPSRQQDKTEQSNSKFAENEPAGKGSASRVGASGTGANALAIASDKASPVHPPSDTQGMGRLGTAKLSQLLNTTLDLPQKSEENLPPGPRKALEIMRQRLVPYNKSTLRQRQIARDMKIAEEITEPSKALEGMTTSMLVTEIQTSNQRKNMSSENMHEAASPSQKKGSEYLETEEKGTNDEAKGDETVNEKIEVKKKNRKKKRGKGKGVDREPEQVETEQAARVAEATPPKGNISNESAAIVPREIITREGRIILIHQAVLPIRNKDEVQEQKTPEKPAAQHQPKQKETEENQLDQDEQTPPEQSSSHISSPNKVVKETEENPETLQPPSFLDVKGKKKMVSVTLPWSLTIKPGDFEDHTKITQLMRDARLHEEYLDGVLAKAEWLENMCAEELAHFGKLYLEYDPFKYKFESSEIEKKEEDRVEKKNSALAPPFFQEQDENPWTYKRMYTDEYVRLQLKGQALDSFSPVFLGKRKRPPTEDCPRRIYHCELNAVKPEENKMVSRASRRKTLTYMTRDEWNELMRMSRGFLNTCYKEELGLTTEQVDKECQTSPEQISYFDIHYEDSETETEHLCEACLQETAACSALKNARSYPTKHQTTKRSSSTTRADTLDREILGISKECIIYANIELDAIRRMIKNFRLSSTSENPIATAYAELDAIKEKIAKVRRLTTPPPQETSGEADSGAGPSGASHTMVPSVDGAPMKQFHKILDDTLRNILIVEKMLELGFTQAGTLPSIPEVDESLIATVNPNAKEPEVKKEVREGGIRKWNPKQKRRS